MAEKKTTAKTETAETKPRPKRGRGGTQNFSNAATKALEETPKGRAAIRKIHSEIIEAWRKPKVKSDEELCDRLAEYFERCLEKEVIPTIEEMWLYCGYYRDWARDIFNGHSKGFSPQTALIIKKAKEYLATFDGKAALEGEINPIVYFFRAKNYYGMVDKQEIEVSPTIGEASIDAAAIRAKYLGNDAPPTLEDKND
jgi:hypothetical protein